MRNLRKNVSLKKYTSFRIGGRAKYFFTAKNEKDLIKAIKWAIENKTPFFILGKGSNLLVSDKGYKGLAIRIQMSNIKPQIKSSPAHRADKNQRVEILAESGAKLRDIVRASAELGLTGIEWATGIPGSLGGAVRGNAGAFGRSISDITKKVKALTISPSGNIKIKLLNKKQCGFSYKQSIFKKNQGLIVLSVVLGLKKSEKEKVKKAIADYLDYRRRNHPRQLSAGCVFKNQEVKIKNKNLLKEFPKLKEFNKEGLIPSAFLIEQAGLKGRRVGGAQISPKHANFIVNLGKAKGSDVLSLIKMVKSAVRKKFGLTLKEEIQYLGF